MASAAASSVRRRSPGRRLAFALLTVLGLLAVLELGSCVALRITSGGSVTVLGAARKRAEILGEAAPGLQMSAASEPQWRKDHVLHPYLGYVRNPDDPSVIGDGLSVTDFGFFDRGSPVLQRRDDRLIVGIVGGSVAAMLRADAEQTLIEELHKSPRFADREIDLVSMALAAYKEPQQLMALNYLLSLGGELDILVNLDGFNEVVMHPAESASLGIYPAYPRNWFIMTQGYQEPEVVALLGQVTYLWDQRRDWSRWFSGSLLRWTATGNLLWSFRDAELASEIGARQERFLEYRPEELRYETRGPTQTFATEDEMFQDLVELWAQCSRLLYRECGGNGIQYFHFLQPNQYHPDSKPLSKEELAVAFRPKHPYRNGVLKGYPLLIEAGNMLSAEGVPFTDLTGLFRDVEEPLYSDPCCHLNPEGSARLARAIAQVIVAANP